MARDPDVLVVGGGPAGATAARTLALQGRRVQLLDRARFPRNKPCGGAVSMRALRRFPYLRDQLPRISTRRLSRLYLEAPSGDGIALTSHEPAALMVRRLEFDALLLELARDAGAEVVEGVEVSRARETKDDDLRRQIVAVVDGFRSELAASLANRGVPAAEATAAVLSAAIDGLVLHRGLGAGPDTAASARLLRRLVTDIDGG